MIDLRYWNVIRELMAKLDLPATEESTSYGTPAFKVKKTLLMRLWEDGETLVIHSDDRDEWLADDAAIFFVTEHYRNYPYVLVRLKKIKKLKLRTLILQCWKEVAPQKLVGEWNGRTPK